MKKIRFANDWFWPVMPVAELTKTWTWKVLRSADLPENVRSVVPYISRD